jgi:hypothetical protein
LLTILKKASILDAITPFNFHSPSKKSRGIAIKFTKLKDKAIEEYSFIERCLTNSRELPHLW